MHCTDIIQINHAVHHHVGHLIIPASLQGTDILHNPTWSFCHVCGYYVSDHLIRAVQARHRDAAHAIRQVGGMDTLHAVFARLQVQATHVVHLQFEFIRAFLVQHYTHLHRLFLRACARSVEERKNVRMLMVARHMS